MFTPNLSQYKHLQYIHTEVQQNTRYFFAVTLSDCFPIAQCQATDEGAFYLTEPMFTNYNLQPVANQDNLYPTQLCEF